MRCFAHSLLLRCYAAHRVRIPSIAGTEPDGRANRDMPWRCREGRLLSLPRVRKPVLVGEPLLSGVRNRPSERLTEVPIGTGPGGPPQAPA